MENFDIRTLQLHLYVFMFDKNLTKIQGHGGVASLADGYSQAGITILQMTSVCGSEEVALVDSSARIRVFSFVTAKFRFVSSLLNLYSRALLKTDW